MGINAGLGAFLAAGLVGQAFAQQAAYGQCGGINWSGATTCVSGASQVARVVVDVRIIPAL
ncbi:Beta-glucosidase cel3A [Apiospora kogelbergensis]|uniref:Beta-glucosidase cel3A n=1 Tax=Apiospora kogelbergensis TaxID=1337665 RepID=A0AAW0QAC6_9PEZI